MVFLSNAWAAGGLSITVYGAKSGEGLASALITAFNSVNPEIVADTVSKGSVVFMDGLAPGQYKIRAFQEGDDAQHYHYAAFYDTKSVDSFELGTSVTVTDGIVNNLGFRVVKEFIDPCPTIPTSGSLTINVFDSQTGLGIPGVTVQIKNAENALRSEKELCTTDKIGACCMEFIGVAFKYKIRLSDQTGFYLPEYVPADEDVFSLGQVYDTSSFVDL